MQNQIKQEQIVAKQVEHLSLGDNILKQQQQEIVKEINQTQIVQQQQLKPQVQIDFNQFVAEFLDQQQKFYIQYLDQDFSRQFSFPEYAEWRNTNHLTNPYREKVSPYHIITLQKYVGESLQFNNEGSMLLTSQAYLNYRESVVQEYPFLQYYIYQALQNKWQVSQYGYQLFVNNKANRNLEIQQLRDFIRVASQLTYDEVAFFEFVNIEKGALTPEGYKKYYQYREQKQNQIDQIEIERIQAIKKEIPNLNMYIFQKYEQACQQDMVEVTKEGYYEFEKVQKQNFSSKYLEQLHQDAINEIEDKKKAKKKVGKIIADLDQEQIQYIQQNAQIIGEKQTNDGQSEIDMDKKIIRSSSCECCKGNIYDCEGEACLLLGNCICISEY